MSDITVLEYRTKEGWKRRRRENREGRLKSFNMRRYKRKPKRNKRIVLRKPSLQLMTVKGRRRRELPGGKVEKE